MSKKNTRVKRAFAALLAVGALATATSFADGGTTPPPTSAEGGGGGGP